MRIAERTLTVERLRELFNYDPERGYFIRIKKSTERGDGPSLTGLPENSRNPKGYIHINIDDRKYSAHRLAFLYMTGKNSEFEIDHKNTIRHDNRWDNLRQCTRSQNMQNMTMRSSNKSGYKGVNFHKASGKWAAQIMLDGKKTWLGVHETPELANEAVCEARRAHGEFRRDA